MATRRIARATLLIGLVAALAAASLAAPPSVSAHAEVDASDPPVGGTVPEAPERLRVWFTQELFRREGQNALEVTNAAGERVDDGAPVIDDVDRTLMSVGLQPDLPAGEYTVTWRSLSATDGDNAEGSFTFTVDPTAPATTETPAATAATPTGTAPAEATSTPGTPSAEPAETPFPWWIVVAGAGILAAGAVGAWALRMEAPE